MGSKKFSKTIDPPNKKNNQVSMFRPRDHVESISLAAIMAGADGLIVEAHSTPEKAFSDGKQTLNHYQSSLLYSKAKKCLDFRKSLEYM